MITKDQIQRAATETENTFRNSGYNKESAAEISRGFIAGAEWAVHKTQAENARLREALGTIITEYRTSENLAKSAFTMCQVAKKALEQ